MINFNDLENAFFFVSSEQPFMHSAVINRKTGETFYQSELTDTDEFPDDVDSEDYVAIPHKNDLDLGTELVFDFVSRYLPQKMAEVNRMFNARGAYSRFNSLLDSVGLREKWNEFENEQIRFALRQWCKENGLEINE